MARAERPARIAELEPDSSWWASSSARN